MSGGGSGGLGKVTPPSLNRVHRNQRLFDRLDAGFSRPVVWVQGQPGAGKTTLVASYLAARGVAPLWYRLDAGDADPATLFFYLAEAAGRTRRGASRELSPLRPEHRAALPLFARRFFRELFAKGPSVVVFDDYHEVAAEAALHDLLPHALEETPAGRNVVIISRSAPPAQLARLRVNGVVETVGGDALKMTADEAAGLARERGSEADVARIERLVERTDGWAAGLVLMLEAGGAEHDLTGRQGDTASEVLFDYFAGEVFGRMAPRVQRLLAATALMPDATAASAAELTGEADAGAVLEDRRRRNYFTTRDVEAEPRYRFHPLFRDFLLAGGMRLHRPAEMAALKMRAAAILETEGQPEPAAVLLAAAAADDALAALIKRQAARLTQKGRHDTVAAWLAKLPDALILNDAWLCYWSGTAVVYSDPERALSFYRAAFERFEHSGDVTGQFVAWAGQADAVRINAFGDMRRYDPLIDSLYELLARHPDIPPGEVTLHVAMGMATALSRRRNDRAEIARWQDRARLAARDAPWPGARELIGYSFAIIDLHDANFEAARRALYELPDPRTLTHLPFVDVGSVIAHAMAYLYGQKTGDCGRYVDEGIRRIEGQGHLLWLPLLASIAARDAAARGDKAACEAWLRRARAYADRVAPNWGGTYHCAAAQLEIMNGDPAGAVAHADAALALAAELGWPAFEAFARVARAESLVEAGDLDEADSELDRLDRLLETCAARLCAISVLLLKADVRFSRGEQAAGDTLLAEAMALGRRQGDRRASHLTAARVSRLLDRVLKLGIEPDYVRTFIRASGFAAPDPDDGAWPWPLAIRTLGGLDVTLDGQSLRFPRKTPKRLITLLKAIAAHGGSDVPEEKLIDAVWPDEDGDAGRQSFKIAIHRLRKLLGDAAAVAVAGGKVSLDPARCWLDVRAFERLSAPRAADESAEAFDDRRARALALYRGDFLAGEDDLYWAAPRRSQCRARFVRAACEAAERRAEAGRCDDAEALCRQAIEAAPDSEELCQALMRRCLASGRGAEGLAAYERLRAKLDETAGVPPTPATDALRKKLLAM